MTSRNKTLYVGGLAEEADRNIVMSAFLSFGDVLDVNLPIDYSTQKHKGFAFVEFQSADDAADAIDNMDNGEILGKTIRVNFAKPVKFKDSNNRPVWASDNYLREVDGDGDGDDQVDEAAHEIAMDQEGGEAEGETGEKASAEGGDE